MIFWFAKFFSYHLVFIFAPLGRKLLQIFGLSFIMRLQAKVDVIKQNGGGLFV